MCNACHTPDYCEECHKLMRHDTKWLKGHGSQLVKFGETKEWSGLTMHQLCYHCHTKQSCDECHRGALPESHKAPDFLQRHGELVGTGDRGLGTGQTVQNAIVRRTNQQACATCHTKQFCDNCHIGAKPKSHEQPNFVLGRGTRGGDELKADMLRKHSGKGCKVARHATSRNSAPTVTALICLTHKTSSKSMSVKPERTWHFAKDATLGTNLNAVSATANDRLPTHLISDKLTHSELPTEASVVKSATVATLAWTATSCRCPTP